jgi:hypothetical protein
MKIWQAGLFVALGLALAGCAKQEMTEMASMEPAKEAAAEPKAAAGGEGRPAPFEKEKVTPVRRPAAVGKALAREGKMGEGAVEESPPAPNGADTLAERIDAYLASLRRAAYAFNVPSPVKVAKPVTVQLWLDPQTSSQQLAADLGEALRATQPEDRVESGQVKIATVMRATLKGDDFTISPVTEETQPVSAVARTHWVWEVTPKHPGHNLPLYLSLHIVLPQELAGRAVIEPPLDKRIEVEVTGWWLLDTYWEKYWQWLLGGLGTAFASLAAWWWKRRQGAA